MSMVKSRFRGFPPSLSWQSLLKYPQWFLRQPSQIRLLLPLPPGQFRRIPMRMLRLCPRKSAILQSL